MTEENVRYYNGIATFLGQTMGMLYEIYIYDTEKTKYELIASYNQGENTEEIVFKFVKDAVETNVYKNQGYYVGHSITTAKHNFMKISVCRMKSGDEADLVLAICTHCDSLLKAEAVISAMLGTNLGGIIPDGTEDRTIDDRGYSGEFGLNKITEYIDAYGIERGRTKPYEREEIICDLYDLGVFNYKGAVTKVAEELGISDKSVYRILSKIRTFRG